MAKPQLCCPGGGLQRVSPAPWADLLAGLTLWGVLVPEGLAYAGMAGLPVQAGLYTLLASLPLYFLLGKSPVLVCAATSSESILMAAVVAPLAGGDPARFLALSGLLVLTTGAVFLLAGFVRLGRISSFLSKPVMTGFIFGLAVFIAINQMHKILGMPRGHGDALGQLAWLAAHVGQANPATACVGLASLALLLALHRFAPRIPSGLVVMALGIAASRALNLGPSHHVAVVHAFPAGLPGLVEPQVGLKELGELAAPACGLALVAFSQALGAVESYAGRTGRHADADAELKALGAANIGASLLGGLLAGGSMSSTAVNVAAGARSKLSGLVTWGMVVLTLLVFTPVFQGLPEAVLGAVVLHAVLRLMKVAEMLRYRRLNRNEFAVAFLALFGVVLLGILPGLVLAVFGSLLLLILYASEATVSVLGRAPTCPGDWLDIVRHPEAAPDARVRVLRLDRPLFFANAWRFYARILELCRQEPKPLAVVLQFRANMRLCVTSTDMLRVLVDDLRLACVTPALVDPAPDVLAILRRGGVLEALGEDRIYASVEQAVDDLAACGEDALPQTPPA